MANPDNEIRVLSKAIAVLNALAQSAGGTSLNEVAAVAGINKATCHRILSTLAAGDFVERSAPGRYRLGIGVFQVGAAMGRSLDLRERALPVLMRLAEETDETVFLCVRRDWRAVCIERIEGKFVGSLALKLGGSLPLHVGGSPRVLLAAMSDEQIDDYLHHELQVLTRNTRTVRSQVLRDLAKIRMQGGAISNEDVTIGAKAFGAPIYDHEGLVTGAVSLSGITARIPPKRERVLFNKIREAGAQISAAMGHGGVLSRVREGAGS